MLKGFTIREVQDGLPSELTRLFRFDWFSYCLGLFTFVFIYLLTI